MSLRIVAQKSAAPIPWQDRPAGSDAPVWRYTQNPLISWNPAPGLARAYNSAVIPFGDAFAGVFRCDHTNGRAHLHFGTSPDALNWTINSERIRWVDEKGNDATPSYAYDPRVVKIDDVWYITWCDDFNGASVGAGYTKDFKTFIRLPNPLLPFNRNGVLFPRKINGKYMLLSRPSDGGHTPFGDVFLSESPDMIHWGCHKLVMKKGGQGWWQGTKIGTGPAPIETGEGWLLIYHGVSSTCNGFVYSFGAAVLDIDEPYKVKYRASDYILTPELDYETRGFVPNVVFPCATLIEPESGKIAIYYGAADTCTALCFCYAEELVNFAKKNNEIV